MDWEGTALERRTRTAAEICVFLLWRKDGVKAMIWPLEGAWKQRTPFGERWRGGPVGGDAKHSSVHNHDAADAGLGILDADRSALNGR
jgi:hypothetical protein